MEERNESSRSTENVTYAAKLQNYNNAKSMVTQHALNAGAASNQSTVAAARDQSTEAVEREVRERPHNAHTYVLVVGKVI